ncbi:MAG: threonine/serine exporter family protein [Clostridiales bacterium]|nr:threonine/serine exporter family protein [Clostridiales bacterium]
MKKLLDLALDIGEQMIMCGAEVHRVEDTLFRICKAFGAKRVDVFIITTSMVVTLHDVNGNPFTQTRRLTSAGSDFDKLSKLNALSRKICSSDNLQVDWIESELKQILNEKSYPLWLEFVSYSIIASCFTLFFNGTIIQALVSLFIGLAVRLVVLFSDKFLNNKIFAKLISSVVLTALAFLAHAVKIVDSVDEIIIGNIMVLIPGIGLTNSLRDLFTGDSMAGTLRLIEALLTALAIALGYLLFVFISRQQTYYAGVSETVEFWQMAVQVVTGVIGSVGFGILFNVKGKHLFAVGFGGGFAWAIYLLLFSLIKNEVICYFIVSLSVSLYCELMARIMKAPTTVFITPSLIPLIPGASLYHAMTTMFRGDIVLFGVRAVATLQLAAALALGVIVSTAIMKIIYTLILKRKVSKR